MTLQNAFGNLALDATGQQVVTSLSTQTSAVTGQLAQLDTDVKAGTAAQTATNTTLTGTLNPSGTAITISGTRDHFRDGFTSGGLPDPTVWTLINDTPDTGTGQGHLVLPGGDALGSAYLRVSLSPFVSGTGVQIASVASFTIPIRHAWGISMSQRLWGQEVIFGLAEAPTSGGDALGINRTAQPADLPINGTVTTTGTIATLNFASPHGLKGGDRVIVFGNAKRELNVGPVQVTVIDAFNVSVSATLAAGTYTGGGYVRMADPSANINNCALQLWGDSTTTTNGTYAARRNGTKTRYLLNQGTVTSSPTQNTGSSYSDAWQAAGPSEIWANIDEVAWRSWTDGLSGLSGYNKMQQSIPDETLSYRLYTRAKNLDNLSRPIARIVSIAKSGTTTATITTDVAHNLAVGDTISVVGVRDQTNFPAQLTSVASVTSATVFTAVVGGVATVSDANGGAVWLNHGGINTPGNINIYPQSIGSTVAGVLDIVGSTTWSGASIGDTVQVYGLVASAQTYEGAYKVLRLNGTTMSLAPLATAWNGTTFGSITTGGDVIRRTDIRLHFARILAHTRTMTEIIGGRGSTSDQNNAVPVSVTSSANLNTLSTLNLVGAEGAPLTIATLAGGASFTMSSRDSGVTVGQRDTSVRIVVLHAATDFKPLTLTLQQSVDNGTFRETHRIPVPSEHIDNSRYHTFELPITHRYWRLVATNTSAATQAAFYLGETSFRGQPANDFFGNLRFDFTPAAGSAVSASATWTGPSLDLGSNHCWSTFRVWINADQATATGGIQVQYSMDGTTWNFGSTTTLSAAGIYEAEFRVQTRYIRLAVVNNTTAMAALKAVVSLIGIN